MKDGYPEKVEQVDEVGPDQSFSIKSSGGRKDKEISPENHLTCQM